MAQGTTTNWTDSATHLTVRFPKVGLMVGGTQLTVSLDGAEIFRGDFIRGFEVPIPVVAGQHVIETTIGMGCITRQRRVFVEVPTERRTVVTLEYSRLWGNFTKSPTVLVQ